MVRLSSPCLFILVLCVLVPITAQAQVINEYVANHTGNTDDHEYVEIFGSPSTDYSSLTIVEIEGDVDTSTGSIGRIDQFFTVGTTDGSGYWTTGMLTEKLENGSMTLLLVSGFFGHIGDDVDIDNDGDIDIIADFWATVIDQVSVWDGDSGDGLYCTTVLSQSMDDDYHTPGGATIDNVFRAGLTKGGGAWSTGFLSDNLEGGSTTILLVKDFTGALDDDLDGDDNGTFDASPLPWSEITDGVAVTDGDAGDFAYTGTVLDPDFDGSGTAVLGASRFHSGIDTDAGTDWIRNDFDGAGLSGFPGTITSGEAYNTPLLANRVTPGDYYASVDDTTQTTLRTTLHDAIKDHIRHEYSTDGTDVWDILKEADEDPNNGNNVLTVYKNSTVVKSENPNILNREHTWPKSLGFPDKTLSNSPYTDCHMLMMADPSYNESRSNRAYGTCDASCAKYVTDENNGAGGVGGPYLGDSNWGKGTAATGTWETWVGRRGDVARAQMYFDVRYEGGTHGFVGTDEPDLILTDDTGLIAASQTGSNESTAYMGRRSVLLQWAASDPVSADEIARNEVVYKHQGNRNPFVDHPEWVSCIFEGTGCGEEIFTDGFEDGTTGGWSTATP